MIQAILDIPEDEVLQILALRLASDVSASDTFVDEILEMDGSLQCMTREDENEVKKEVEKSLSSKERNSEYTNKWKEKSAAAAKAKAKGDGQGAGRGAGAGRGRGRGGRRGPIAPRLELPEGDLPQPVVKQLTPPGASVWRGNIQGCWHGHCPPFRRVSASWHVYGQRGAAIIVLQLLWGQHLTVAGLRCPQDCPVHGLFAVPSEEGAAEVLGSGGAASSAG